MEALGAAAFRRGEAFPVNLAVAPEVTHPSLSAQPAGRARKCLALFLHGGSLTNG